MKQIYIIILFIILHGVRLRPLGTAAITGLLYQPQMIDDSDRGAIGGTKTGNQTEVLGETCTGATLSTTNPT
jgi:hypothetical protein